MERIYISIMEAGDALGVSRSTIYRIMEGSQLETVKIGRRRLVRIKSLERVVHEGWNRD